jgi:lipopolysaccharide export system protein LptA
MRSVAFASLAAVALIAICAGAAPTPAPSPAPTPAPSPATSARPAASPSGTASAKPALPSLETPDYRIETDDISYKGNGDFTMPHHVSLARPGSDATADRAEGNQKRGTISLFGNVVVHDNGKAPEAETNDEYAKGGPSTLTCDRLDIDSKAKIYTAIGHVHFEQGARKAEAEHGTLNRGNGMLHLEGNVKTSDGASVLTAKVLDYNLNSKAIVADGKPIMIKQPVPTPAPGSISPSPKPRRVRLPFPT